MVLCTGCSFEDAVKADVDVAVEAKVEAKFASVDFKADLSKEVSNQLNATTNQTTGGWGISIGTLQVDGSTLIMFIAVAGAILIVVVAVGVVLYVYIKKYRKSLKINKILVQSNEDVGLSADDKYKIMKKSIKSKVSFELDKIVGGIK